MSRPSILISGASVAGPALAFWLTRLGYAVTIVEKSPALRPGGHAVDFRGTAIEVLHRMGLYDAVAAQATQMGDMIYVNARDREVARMPASAFSGEVEIMRGDLARVLYEATADDVTYLFGDTITRLQDLGTGVEVAFASGREASYDIVVGADGIHSNVRALAFAPEAGCVTPLGLAVSIFSVPNRLGLDHSGRLLCAPGRVASVSSVDREGGARAMLYFRADAGEMACRDSAGQQAIIRRRFADLGWQVPQLLADMPAAPDFYYDGIGQVQLQDWWRGRIVLIGDAAGCASPLSGMGTSIAAVAAYVLAQELAATPDDPPGAFARYQGRLAPFVSKAQAFARSAVGHFTPAGWAGVLGQRLVMKVLARLPADFMLKEVNAAANCVALESRPTLPNRTEALAS